MSDPQYTLISRPTERELIGCLRGLVRELNDLIAESDGVAGLHRNGELCHWGEMLEGGECEAWLANHHRAADMIRRIDFVESSTTEARS